MLRCVNAVFNVVTQANVDPFFHEATNTWSYLVSDPETGAAAIVDPVMDFDASSGRIGAKSVGQIIEAVNDRQLKVQWVLETHAHADHLTAAQIIKRSLGGEIAIGRGIQQVQKHFSEVFQISADGDLFDRLFNAGEQFSIGSIPVQVVATPGHTPDSLTYRLPGAAFIGDTLFAPDYGTARCDFPGGNAAQLYQSIQTLYGFGDETVLYLCHDYPGPGLAPRCCFTVGEQRTGNVHIGQDTTEEQFVALRTTRDAELSVPKLIIPSLQVNMRAGHLPESEDNGLAYLRWPLDAF